MGFLRTIQILSVSLVLGALFSCGPGEKEKKPKTLAQATEELPEEGFHLCRLNYRYAYSETEKTGSYIALAGLHRDDLRKTILTSCTQLPTEQSNACADPTVFEKMGCVHVQALGDFVTNKPDEEGKVFECSYKSTWYFADHPYKEYETFKMKTAAKKTAAIQALIEECMTLPALERDGCTRTLITGDFRCVQKNAPNP